VLGRQASLVWPLRKGGASTYATPDTFDMLAGAIAERDPLRSSLLRLCSHHQTFNMTEKKMSPEPESSSATPTSRPTSILDETVRFFALYLTSLFSLDPYTAAQNSPHRRIGHGSPIARPSLQTDWGEGAGVGRRLDPTGPPARRPGGVGGNTPMPVIPGCGSCMASVS
jgi:hypothetical protein